MTVHFEVVKYPQPDCLFCGVWRSVMIRIVREEVREEFEDKWICSFCARGINQSLEEVKKEDEK